MKSLKNKKAITAGLSTGSIVFVLVSISTWLLYTLTSELQFQLLREEIENIGKITALEVNVEAQKELTKTEHTNNALYTELITPLVDIHNAVSNILYIYTMRIVDGKTYYLLDTSSSKRLLRRGIAEGANVLEEYQFDPTNPIFIEWIATLQSGQIYTEKSFIFDESEVIISTSIPLFDDSGNFTSFLGIDYDVRLYEEKQLLIQQVCIAVLAFALLLSIILGWRVYIIRKRLDQNHLELYKQANTDFLTGACNRRFFFIQAQNEIFRSQRYEHPLSLLMIDIDHFKIINDTHGHLTGDQVLLQLVKSIQRIMRTNDLIARFGGEEFTILLLDTKEGGAISFAKKIQDEVSNIKIYSKNNALIHFTLSIGISEYKNGWDLDTLVHYADEALYKAKGAGRDQICSSK